MTGPLIRGRRRPLTPDEEDLWSVVVRSVRPLRARKIANSAKGANEAVASQKPKSAAGRASAAKSAAKSAVAKTPVAKVAVARTPVAPPQQPPGPPALQPIMRREIKKIARGNDRIDARIDLHGMTQSEAHAALHSLLRRCQADGAKFVLVITGKGRPDGGSERGVLRRQVPQWLGLPEFRRLVAGYEVARAGHGGEGALYVRLRRAGAPR